MPAAFPIVRDVVLVEGADARSYLQSQLTQNIEAIPVGGSAWSFILDPKSSVEALVRVTRIGHDRLTLDIESGFGDAVRSRLDGRLFRTDARFSQFTWPGVAWRGEGSKAMKVDVPIVSISPWPGIEGLDVVGPNVAVTPGTEAGSPDELERLRIAAGWPAMGAEIGEGVVGVTPAMTGLLSLTVSFDKGCYTGQELVARTHNRGAAPTKRLVMLKGSLPFAVGASILVEGQEVGAVTSATDDGTGIGYLARKVATPVEASVDGVALTVVERQADQPSS